VQHALVEPLRLARALQLALQLQPDLDGLEAVGDGDGAAGGDAAGDEGAGEECVLAIE
jgi:hypothetical protein